MSLSDGLGPYNELYTSVGLFCSAGESGIGVSQLPDGPQPIDQSFRIVLYIGGQLFDPFFIKLSHAVTQLFCTGQELPDALCELCAS